MMQMSFSNRFEFVNTVNENVNALLAVD